MCASTCLWINLSSLCITALSISSSTSHCLGWSCLCLILSCYLSTLCIGLPLFFTVLCKGQHISTWFTWQIKAFTIYPMILSCTGVRLTAKVFAQDPQLFLKPPQLSRFWLLTAASIPSNLLLLLYFSQLDTNTVQSSSVDYSFLIGQITCDGLTHLSAIPSFTC